MARSPFLALDELVRERDSRLWEEGKEASRLFGQSVLNYEKLSREERDRKERMDRQARDDRRADARETRDQAEFERKEGERKLADYATAATAPRKYESPKTLPALPQGFTGVEGYGRAAPYRAPDGSTARRVWPDVVNAEDSAAVDDVLANRYAPPGAGRKPAGDGLAKAPDDEQLVSQAPAGSSPEAVRAALEKARTTRETQEADLAYKTGRVDAQAAAANLARLRAENLIPEQEFKHQMALLAAQQRGEGLRQGAWRISQQGEQFNRTYDQRERFQQERNERAARADERKGAVEALKREGKMSGASEKRFQDSLIAVGNARNILDKLDNGEDTGPIIGRAIPVLRKLAILDPKSAAFAAELQALGNTEIHQLFGSAVSAGEMTRALPSIAGLTDDQDIVRALLKAMINRQERVQDVIIDTAEMNNPAGNTVRKRAEKVTGRPQPGAAKPPEGQGAVKNRKIPPDATPEQRKILLAKPPRADGSRWVE